MVFCDLERNGSHSLKNMVLRDSSVGQRFPIRTATEFQHRIAKYQTLGVKSITPRSATFNLLEHIYEEESHEDYIYEILTAFLSDIPDTPTDAIEILVRARFVAAIETLDIETEAFDDAIDSFRTDLPDPFSDNSCTSSEFLEAASKITYVEPEKMDLIRASLVQKSDLDPLQEYLYLSARDVVERYRHSSRQDPWRGELQLALRQL